MSVLVKVIVLAVELSFFFFIYVYVVLLSLLILVSAQMKARLLFNFSSVLSHVCFLGPYLKHTSCPAVTLRLCWYLLISAWKMYRTEIDLLPTDILVQCETTIASMHLPSCALCIKLALCFTEMEYDTFLIWLAVSFYITLFIAVHIFTQTIIPLAPYGAVSFLKYMTVFCILRPLKKKCWMEVTNNLHYCYCGFWANLYQMCYSCTQLCSNYFKFLF